jgi:hypothetical protein
MRGFGIRIPRELPIRTSSVFKCNYIVVTKKDNNNQKIQDITAV